LLMTVFPPGDNWTTADYQQALTNTSYPAAIVTVFLNLLGLITFYAFPSNRKFPTTVLAWVAIENVAYGLLLIMKWVPGSQVKEDLVLHPAESVCFGDLWADMFNNYALVTLNFLVALTLYLTVCRRNSMDDPKYLYGYAAFFWVVCLVCPFAIAGSPKIFINGTCVSDQPASVTLSPLFVFILLQIFFMGSAFRVAAKIINAARSISSPKKDIRLLYMIIRFSLTIIAQMIAIVVYLVVVLSNNLNTTLFKWAIITGPAATCLDAVVLIGGNRPLMKWCMRKVGVDVSSSSLSSELPTRSQNKDSAASRNSNKNVSVSRGTENSGVSIDV